MLGTIGTAHRLARLLCAPGGRAACLAFDHGAQLGPIAGTEDPGKVIAMAVDAELDGIILAPGLATRYAELLRGKNRPVVILRLDQTSMWRVGTSTGYPSGHTRRIASVEEAVKLGADAVLTYFFTCHTEPELETRSIEIAAEAARAAREWGIPIIMEPMAARGGIVPDPFDPEIVAMNSRIAAEIGADIIKTDWTGSARSFKPVVATATAPILAAGGVRTGSDEDVLRTIGDILKAGAKGVLFGRNMFQSPDPGTLMRRARDLIHNARPPRTAKAAGVRKTKTG